MQQLQFISLALHHFPLYRGGRQARDLQKGALTLLLVSIEAEYVWQNNNFRYLFLARTRTYTRAIESGFCTYFSACPSPPKKRQSGFPAGIQFRSGLFWQLTQNKNRLPHKC